MKVVLEPGRLSDHQIMWFT